MKNKSKKNMQSTIIDNYRSIIGLSNEAILIFDTKLNIIEANVHFAKLFDIKIEKSSKVNLNEIFSSKDLQNENPIEIIIAETIKKKEIQNFKLKIKINNKGHNLNVNAQLIEATESNTPYIVSFWSKSAKKIKQDDSETKRKYKTLLDNLKGFAFRCLIDKYWTMKFVSFAFTKITGYEAEDIINNKRLTYNELIVPEDRQRVWDELQPAINNQQHYEIKYKIRKKNGEIIYVEEQGIGIYNDNNEPIAIEGYIIDITKNILEKKALTKSENLNRSITQTAADAIITVNSNGLINSWNLAATKIFGYSEKETIGKKIADIIPESKEIIENAIGNPLESKELTALFGRTLELTAIHKNTSSIPIELSLSKYEFSDEIFFTAIVRDIRIRKRNEHTLKKLSTAVRHSPSVIVITDVEGKIEYVNPKFTELTKYTLKEVRGENPRILNSGEQSQEFYKEMWETILAGNIWKGEVHNKKKTGELFWESVSISPIYNENNEITSFIKIAEDVTQQRSDLLKLKKSEESYRKLIATTSEGFWLIDTESKTTLVNESLCKMLGYTKEEMLGKTPFDFVDEKNLIIFKHQISQNSNNKQRIYEIQLQKKDGKNIDALFSATTMLDHEDKFQGSFAFVRNISEQKRSQLIQGILYNISKANTISDNLQALISIIRKEVGKVVDTTNFYVALYDKKNNLLSFPYYSDKYDNFTKVNADKTLTKYVIETRKPILADNKLKKEFEDKGLLKFIGTNSQIWMGVPLINNDEVFGVLALQNYEDKNAYSENDLAIMEIIADQISISIHRKQSETDLKYALEKAKESDKLKSAFLQNISHEIRTPMNGLLGFTSLLKNTNLSVDEQQEYIDIILESGNRLLNTFDDIMNISMIETGQVNINSIEFNLSKELKQQFRLHETETKQKGLKLIIDQKNIEEEILLQTDYDKFNSILSYLIRNAIKYTFEGSIKVGYNVKSNFLEFFVEDSGIGIPPDRLDAIFDIFVQADLSEVKAKEGSGLGLSITKAYVEMLGGKIWAKSEEGKGSCFFFTIQHKHNEDEIVSNQSKMVGNLKILIVEDEDFSSEFLKVVLDNYASEFLRAKNGKEAIDIAKENLDIDIIFMDLRMPIVNGYEATKEIRKFNSKVKIIAQTAYALQGDDQKAIQAGCNDYISKPINTKALLEKVDNMILEMNNDR